MSNHTYKECFDGIKKLIERGGDTTFNGDPIFKYSKHCNDMAQFKSVFNLHFQKTHTYDENRAKFGGRVMTAIGMIFIGVGSALIASGDNVKDGSVVIRKKT